MGTLRLPLIASLVALASAIVYRYLFTMTATENGLHATSQWADGPCPMIHTPRFESKKDDLWTSGATHMALLHNAILRGFNTIYLQAPHVLPQDYADFIGYSLAWYRLVKSHHDDEETELFPKVEDILNEKGIWDETILEHESFMQGLAAFHTYLCALPSPSSFSGSELVRIMDVFRDPFTNHFHSEVRTIASFSNHPSAPAPNSNRTTVASLTFKSWGKKTLTKAGMTDVVPFALLNLDRTFEDGMWASWPPMPGPIRWMLLNVFGSWNWGWWKFSSCDSTGAPRPLYALQHTAQGRH